MKEHLKKIGYLLVSGFDKEINASYKSRVNLRTHVKKRHNGLLPTFDELYQENNSKKSEKPETKAATKKPETHLLDTT